MCDIDDEHSSRSGLDELDDNFAGLGPLAGTLQDDNDDKDSNWKLFGKFVPRNEIVFICQVVILYIVILTCIVNLSIGNGDSNLWTALLSSSLGLMLPAPSFSKSKTQIR